MKQGTQTRERTASVANLATFQTPFFKKRLATNLATFGKTLATFQMSPVLSCEREILSYTSPCVCSDQWVLAPAERSSTFSDRTAADIDVNELRMCTPAAISLRLQGKLSFPYNCQKMNGQIYVLLC